MRYAAVFAVAVLLMGAGQAMAVPVYTGEGDTVELGNSWSMVNIKESNVPLITEMRFEIDYNPDGTTFEGEVAGNLGSGWTQWAVTGTILRISGPAVTELYPLTLNFSGTPSPLQFKWQAFSALGVMVDNCEVQYNYSVAGAQYINSYEGHNWTYTTSSAEAVDPIVPEPVTMAGLMMGIGGLVTYVRKRRKA